MKQCDLKIEDVGEAGSFHKKGGSHIVRMTSTYRPDLSAIVFQCILNEDNDGAPDCYAPTQPPGLDSLPDGTSDGNAKFDPATGRNKWAWVGLVSMTHNDAQSAGVLDRLDERPEVKDINGRFPLFQPSKKFYVSTTASAADVSKAATDQARYWNAREISYGALTPPLRRLGVRLGDFGLAVRLDTGASAGFVYADAGGQNKVGESSRKLYRSFFPHADQENHPVAFLVFPRSAHRTEGGGFRSDSTLALRTRIQDLALADNSDAIIALMASGRKYWDYDLGTALSRPAHDPWGTVTRDVGPFSLSTPQARVIARTLHWWGFDPIAARKWKMGNFMGQVGMTAKDFAARSKSRMPGASARP